MVSANSFAWLAAFGKNLTAVRWSSRPVYSDKRQAPLSDFDLKQIIFCTTAWNWVIDIRFLSGKGR